MTRLCVAALGVALALALCSHTAVAQTLAAKPAIPPGAPTRGGGLPVIAEGFDYHRPAILQLIARDGEGTAIAYDARDDDARPFLADAASTAAIEQAQATIVPVRVDATEVAWRRAFAYVRQLPIAVVVILAPTGSMRAQVEAAIKATPGKVFILPASDAPKLAAANTLTVAALPSRGARIDARLADVVLAPAAATREAPTAGTGLGETSAVRALLAITLFGCHEPRGDTAAAVVAQLVARAQKGPAGTAPLLEHCGLPQR